MILAIDPGISCTGYCLLDTVGPDGSIHEAGRIVPGPSSKSLGDRARSIVSDINELVHDNGIDAVVIETPQTVARGKRNTRSASTLPTYGVAVGAILAGVHVPDLAERIEVSATEWTRGIPTTSRDKDKSNRVMLVERIYGMPSGSLGPKTTAGNVADAVLLARWAMLRRRAK